MQSDENLPSQKMINYLLTNGEYDSFILLDKDEIIAQGKNMTEETFDPTNHSIVNALRNAGNTHQKINFSGMTILTKTKPCSLCISAVSFSSIRKIFYLEERTETNSILIALETGGNVEDFLNIVKF